MPRSPRRLSTRKRNSSSAQTNIQLESLESRQLLSVNPIGLDPSSIFGTGNNQQNAAWGSTGEELLRLTSVEYGDGIESLAGGDRPSARVISNAVVAQTELEENARELTDYVWIWGQFIDHDIDLTTEAHPVETASIAVPQGDAYFDPFATGAVEIGFTRSNYADPSLASNGFRQQINDITAFLDGSVIYGSDEVRADALREFTGGRLKTSAGDLLPFNELGLANAGGPSSSLFLAGDIRANENVALTSMHTIWVREHNRIADELAAENPDLTDEQIYQAARRTVVAELQAITYNEFLPALLGRDALAAYDGYDANVNPGIANIFSTAAYRLGHSLLSPELLRTDAAGNEVAEGNLALRDAFFNPDEVVTSGVDAVLQGAARQLAQELDTELIDDVRNFLFGPPGAGGFDLASLNIQRGRDHGLADYNQARIDLGLAPVDDFDDITSDVELQARLASVYDSVDEIDVWIGGLAEDHVAGSSVGELFQTVLVDQFERLRDGDRFWYQNTFTGHQLKQLEQTTLADVIERNSDVTDLQRNVFFSLDADINTRHRHHSPRQKNHRDQHHSHDSRRGLPSDLARADHENGRPARNTRQHRSQTDDSRAELAQRRQQREAAPRESNVGRDQREPEAETAVDQTGDSSERRSQVDRAFRDNIAEILESAQPARMRRRR